MTRGPRWSDEEVDECVSMARRGHTIEQIHSADDGRSITAIVARLGKEGVHVRRHNLFDRMDGETLWEALRTYGEESHTVTAERLGLRKMGLQDRETLMFPLYGGLVPIMDVKRGLHKVKLTGRWKWLKPWRRRYGLEEDGT